MRVYFNDIAKSFRKERLYIFTHPLRLQKSSLEKGQIRMVISAFFGYAQYL